MSLLKGSVNLTRYHIVDEYPDLLDEILAACIRANAFLDRPIHTTAH